LFELGQSCNLNSDCQGELVCLFGVCHEQCEHSDDCPAGERCLVGDKPLRVCSLETEGSCAFHSDCPTPLICSGDDVCRVQCAADRDCVRGQRCVSGSCADESELAAGRLPSGNGSAVGKPCGYSSDCPPGPEGVALVCRDRLCDVACFEERDCPRFHRCTTASDPDAPGDCVLIGERGLLFCDPDEDPAGGHRCACPGDPGAFGTQQCLPDGSGLSPCDCTGA
jgi:hypothetical protein